jgi:hypothetical protein
MSQNICNELKRLYEEEIRRRRRGRKTGEYFAK